MKIARFDPRPRKPGCDDADVGCDAGEDCAAGGALAVCPPPHPASTATDATRTGRAERDGIILLSIVRPPALPTSHGLLLRQSAIMALAPLLTEPTHPAQG